MVKDYRMPAWPVRHDGAPPAVKASPLLGEHSAEVLKDWLGLSEREVEGLLQDRVVGRPLRPLGRRDVGGPAGAVPRITSLPQLRDCRVEEDTTMAELTGSEILAKALKKEGTDNLLFIMGGPMLLAEASCIKEGIRPIDVRHEQAAALMGQAYSRLLQTPERLHGRERPGRDQPHHRHRQRA